MPEPNEQTPGNTFAVAELLYGILMIAVYPVKVKVMMITCEEEKIKTPFKSS